MPPACYVPKDQDIKDDSGHGVTLWISSNPTILVQNAAAAN